MPLVTDNYVTMTSVTMYVKYNNAQMFTIFLTVTNSRTFAVTVVAMYRVAQNKIPHQTICNIFATSGQI